MKNKYISYMQKHLIKLLLLLPFFLAMPKANASHLTGGDMSYECLGGGQYRITFKVYRDCQGIPMCNCPGMAGCSLIGVSVTGADPSCAGVSFGNITMTVQPSNVSGFDVIQLCRSATTICTNCGTRTPGSYTPGIEVYTFTGTVNLNSVAPASCCNVTVGWSDCCRNNAITNLQNPSSLSYFVGATINRCVCSSAPTFTNDPVALVCAGQEFTYNLGAVDPDGDSLSYAFGSSQTAANTSAPYKTPFNATTYPFPYSGAPLINQPPPFGLNIDPVTGDVRFMPVQNFVSNFVIEVTQWKYLPGGAPYKVGVTRRDIQFYCKADCPPNNPPKFITYKETGEFIDSKNVTTVPTPNPIPGNYSPKISWSVCAKSQLCFIIEARDDEETQDTTDMAWNSPSNIVNNGIATFQPTYPRYVYPNSNDHIGVIKYDRWKFCWTPNVTAYTPTMRPYYFSVSARDRACPVPARTFKTFAITVNQTPDATIAVDYFKCGTYRFKYTVTPATANVTLNDAYTRWYVETDPGSGNYVEKMPDASNKFTMTTTFKKGGKYNVYMRLSSMPPPAPSGCPNDKIPFVVTVPDPVSVDPPAAAYNCFGSSVKVNSNGHFGLPGANRFEYFQLVGTTYTSVRGKSFDSTATITPPTSSNPPYNTSYMVKITEPTQNCVDSAFFTIATKPLPSKDLFPEIRICQSTDTTFWADGANKTTPANSFYKWYKYVKIGGVRDTFPFTPSKTPVSANSLPVTYKDSGDFMLIKTDAFGCKVVDKTTLDVNSFPIKGGAGQNACLNDPPLVMEAVVPVGATVSNIRWYEVNTPSVTLSTTTSFTIPTNVLGKKKYVISSNTVFAGVACPASDTITAEISAQPILNPITPYTICNNVPSVYFPKITSSNKFIGNVVWSYPLFPAAISGNQFNVSKIPTPPSTNTAYGDYIDLLAYDTFGCTVAGKMLVAIFPAPIVTVGPQKIICDYDKPFSLRPMSAPFNIDAKFEDRWYGRGIDSVINGIKVIGTINEYFFNPQRADVRKANPKDTNIITYEFTKLYESPSGYVVQLPASVGPAVAGPADGCPCKDTIIFEVVKTPKVSVSAGKPVCKSDLPINLNVQFNAKTEALDPTTTKWSFAPPNQKLKAILAPDSNMFDPRSSDIVVAVGAQATYKLNYTDVSTGCIATTSANITVNGPPQVKLSLNDPAQNIVCQSEGKVLIDMQPTPASYSGGTSVGTYTGEDVNKPIPILLSSLSLDASKTQMEFNMSDPEVKETTYKFRYTYANSLGCINSDSLTIDVQAPPQITIFDDISVCSYDTKLNLTTQFIPRLPYGMEWNTNGTGTIADDKAPNTTYTITPDDIAQGGITFTANSTISLPNRECAAATDAATVTINPKPKASFICTSCSGCVNPRQNLVLKPVYQAGDPGLNNTQYFWYIDGNLDASMNTPTDIYVNSSLTQTYTTAGNHKVFLIVSSEKGCVDTATSQTVEAYATPLPQFEPMPRVRTIANPRFNFNNSTSFGSPLTYLWNLGNDPSTKLPRTSTEISPQNVKFAPELSAIRVYLRATSDKGCSDTVSDEIRINPDITVFVPTVFSPSSTLNDPNCSGDCNRSFKVVADGFESIEIFVFNRWGQKVFETRDVNVGWNGTISNNNTDMCPQDAYIYQVNATSFSGKTYQYSGSITLLR
ncbi:MAG: hypothetical protein EBZ58_00070 [Bacteroidetes bacterium]|nr:hypothetical protein [Bacteroidota bacterium]